MRTWYGCRSDGTTCSDGEVGWSRRVYGGVIRGSAASDGERVEVIPPAEPVPTPARLGSNDSTDPVRTVPSTG